MDEQVMETPYTIARYSASSPQGNIAIVGGTGFETLPPEIYAVPLRVETRFGDAQVLSLSDNYVEPFKLFFLSRHNSSHGLAPHQINYKANIAALVELGVTHIIATNAVGSLRRDLAPGALVLFDDFIDFTRSRPITFFEPDSWKHIDFSVPYSQMIREMTLKAGAGLGVDIVPKATYVCCDGPRFESPAEVRMLANWGGDVVGMTGLPEAIYAKEAGLEYAAVGIVTNFGAGLTSTIVDHAENSKLMADRLPVIRELLLHVASLIIIQNQALG